MTRNTFQGYTLAQLKEVFDALADPEDWRAPILATVSGELLIPAVAAIQFYTATTPNVTLLMPKSTGHVLYSLSSVGYRNGPAGP